MDFVWWRLYSRRPRHRPWKSAMFNKRSHRYDNNNRARLSSRCAHVFATSNYFIRSIRECAVTAFVFRARARLIIVETNSRIIQRGASSSLVNFHIYWYFAPIVLGRQLALLHKKSLNAFPHAFLAIREEEKQYLLTNTRNLGLCERYKTRSASQFAKLRSLL